jgi:hypothetical protein
MHNRLSGQDEMIERETLTPVVTVSVLIRRKLGGDMWQQDIRALFVGAAIAVTLGLSQGAVARDQRLPISLDQKFTIAVIPDTQNYIDFQHHKADGFPFDAKPMFIA